MEKRDEKKMRDNVNSTKQIILGKANDIINEQGMVDFRIDSLAGSLGLSPGNVTYHFPKKEDIGNAIWLSCNKEIISSFNYYITPLLDIKQLFLFYSFITDCCVKYRGVLCYKMGDIGVLQRSAPMLDETIFGQSRIWLNTIIEYLSANQYVENIKDDNILELTYESQELLFGWWINYAVSSCNIYKDNKWYDLPLMLINPITPFLTNKGINQLNKITTTIK